MKNKKGKVLLFYPNSEGYPGIPDSIALLSGCLKKAGFETGCFDTTFINSPPKAHLYRQKHGGIMKADYTKAWGGWTPDLPKKAFDFFLKAIKEFKPDLIAVSIVDICYTYAVSLLNKIKKEVNIPVIAGGITVTMSPEMVIGNDGIDIICIGEGEGPLVELANCIVEGKNYDNIKNLWVKKDTKIIKNPLRPLKDITILTFQDWSIFDKRHYYKMYCGDAHRTGFFELVRGCPFNCTYCATANLRKVYHGLGKFIRERDIDNALDEVVHIKNKYDLQLLFFIDDNFLGMPPGRFNYFCQQYEKRVNLPFYIQTRSETVKEDYIKRLKKANISTIAIGVEHGNEEYRKKYMNRHMSNESLQRAFDIIHKYDIRSTANVIIGMPYETESVFKDVIALLRRLKPRSISIDYFMPFRGTKMREMAVKLGYISEDHVITDTTKCLDMPQFRKERIIHYYENFKKYLDG